MMGTYLTQDFRYVLVVFAVLVQNRGRVPQHDQPRVPALAAGGQSSPVRMDVDRKDRHTGMGYPYRF